MTMSGSPNRLSPLPNLVISHEDYAMLARQINRGATPKLEGAGREPDGRRSRCSSGTPSARSGAPEWPGQVVILGAHLDSWDLGTGVTDNGTGSMVVLEAARVIARRDSSPSARSGSSCSAGKSRGCWAPRPTPRPTRRRRTASRRCWCWITEPVRSPARHCRAATSWRGCGSSCSRRLRSLDADSVREASKSGTDHLSFLPYGVPGFNFDQLRRGYDHTHHSETDTYDKAVTGT